MKRRATRQRGRPVKDGVRENASFLSRLQAAKEGGTPEEGETRTKGERVRDRTGGEGEEGQGEVAMEGDREARDERREEEEV